MQALPRRVLPASMSLFVAVMLGGCAAPAQQDPGAATQEQMPEEPTERYEFLPDSSAEENFLYFNQTLRDFVLSDAPMEGQAVVDALSDAGFDKGSMQVSFDKTKTGLTVDHLYVSVRIGSECLIGQLILPEDTHAVAVQEAIGPNDDLCLIGNTRAIDW